MDDEAVAAKGQEDVHAEVTGEAGGEEVVPEVTGEGAAFDAEAPSFLPLTCGVFLNNHCHW